jgi:hypothetical protein
VIEAKEKSHKQKSKSRGGKGYLLVGMGKTEARQVGSHLSMEWNAVTRIPQMTLLVSRCACHPTNDTQVLGVTELHRVRGKLWVTFLKISL